jgi:hypothetical protein
LLLLFKRNGEEVEANISLSLFSSSSSFERARNVLRLFFVILFRVALNANWKKNQICIFALKRCTTNISNNAHLHTHAREWCRK